MRMNQKPIPDVGTKHRLYGSHLRYGYYEEAGGNFIERLSEAIKQESWAIKLTSLAWTAGPVTMMALFVSSWIANRSIPSINLIIFIAAYTIIAGLISIIVNIVKRATGTAKQIEAEKILSEVLGKLPDLLITIRNESLLQMSQEKRKIAAAIVLLQDPDATESTIQTALEDLTSNGEMGWMFRRLESYRKKGIFSRVDEYAEEVTKKFKDELEEVRKKSQYASMLLEARLAGSAPSKRFGQRRTPEFISRLINLVESGKFEDIQLEDARELVKLLIEFFVDRKFTLLFWHLEGKSPIIKIWQKLEKLSNQSLRLHRERRLAEYEMLISVDEIRSKIKEEGEVQVLVTGFPNYTFLEDELGKKSFRKLKLHKKIAALNDVKKDIEKIDEKIKRVKDEFSNARKEHPDPFDFSIDDESKGEIRLKIEKESLCLSNKDKIEFTEKLNFYLSTLSTNRQCTRIITSGAGESKEEPRPIAHQELVALILRIFALFEFYIDLSQEGVIDSLDASPAINIGSIDYALSKKTKVGWLHAMVDELLDLPAPIALRAAERIVDEFKQPLSKKFTEKFSEMYDIAPETSDYLSKVNKNS